jgi:hypothetical protein
LGWDGPLVREGRPSWEASRGRQLGGCLATDTFQVKPDGRGAEALPFCGGTHHEEAKAQEGQVGHRDINRDLVTRIDSHEDENPEGHKGTPPMHPRYRRVRPRMSPPRTGACAVSGRKAKRRKPNTPALEHSERGSETEARNLAMGRSSRERGSAPVEGKPWMAGWGVSGDGHFSDEA